MSRPNRRRFLGLAGGAAAVAGLGGYALLGSGNPPGQTAALVRSAVPLPEPFTVPLPVPPVRRPVNGRIDIVQRVAEVEILPGRRTRILGYDGVFPGPTVETRSGEPVTVTHHNRLPVPTATHLHGGHTPHDSDGWPLDLVVPPGWRPTGHSMPGDLRVGSREYAYPMRQRAATLWYHDHRMDFTGPQVYRGLAGFHLVRDAEEDALPLPRGDRELPLLICDRAFTADGQFSYPSVDPSLRAVPGVEPAWMEGVLGDVILVNGAPWPVAEVDAARYRLRLLNASNARRYRLALEPGGRFTQIGSDGGLLARPMRHVEFDIAPGERFDMVVDFAEYPVGTEVTLVNRLETGPAGLVMRFRVARRARDDSSVPRQLTEIEQLRPAEGAVRRDWQITRGAVPKPGRGTDTNWMINGQRFDPARTDAAPALGEVELWRVYSDLHHPVHLHLDPFQVVGRGAHGPGPGDTGWKDTVDLRPAEQVTLAVRFTDYPGRYVMHCHNLEHEDMAMMCVIAPTGAGA
ncbi:multicopper oxidase family protein [Pseudonocardia acaciae]|uniref:multicopper oxidase family protein n=1 Tax=Pseudonocardia acaciae TaxID=551276 RepID=UPI00048C39B0|nr:multicopper oxidase family protein [Pseudonocardia acaciae]